MKRKLVIIEEIECDEKTCYSLQNKKMCEYVASTVNGIFYCLLFPEDTREISLDSGVKYHVTSAMTVLSDNSLDDVKNLLRCNACLEANAMYNHHHVLQAVWQEE